MVRNNEQMFEIMNLSSLSLKILTFLARSPNREFYLREIAKNTTSSVGGCHKALSNLFSAGLINKRKSGRNMYHQVNNENPAIVHFKIFINVLEMEETISMIKQASRKIVLFGSCATGDDTIDSDIDLLVITEDEEKVKKTFSGAHINGRKINAVILSPNRYILIKERDPVFHTELSKGLLLWRDEDDDL